MTVTLHPVDPIGERASWLDSRREGIGASDVAGLLNMSRFSTPMSIYLDKLGLVSHDEGNEATLWGKLLEGVIAREFAERTGLHVLAEQVVAINPERPWERATLDALVGESSTTELSDAIGICEIKNSSDFGWDDVPDEYAVQIQYQMGIAEIEQGWLAVLHGGRRLVVYPMEFQPVVFAELRTVAERFWHDHVLAENPPPVDGDQATTDALKDAYRGLADGTTVEVDEHVEQLGVEWLARKDALATAKAELARVENTLRALLAEHTAAARDGVELVTWKPQATAASFDREGLQRDHPLIAAQYVGEKGTARVLRATKALKSIAGVNA